MDEGHDGRKRIIERGFSRAEQSLEEQLWPKRSPLDAAGQGSDTSGGGRDRSKNRIKL